MKSAGIKLKLKWKIVTNRFRTVLNLIPCNGDQVHVTPPLRHRIWLLSIQLELPISTSTPEPIRPRLQNQNSKKYDTIFLLRFRFLKIFDFNFDSECKKISIPSKFNSRLRLRFLNLIESDSDLHTYMFREHVSDILWLTF